MNILFYKHCINTLILLGASQDQGHSDQPAHTDHGYSDQPAHTDHGYSDQLVHTDQRYSDQPVHTDHGYSDLYTKNEGYSEQPVHRSGMFCCVIYLYTHVADLTIHTD